MRKIYTLVLAVLLSFVAVAQQAHVNVDWNPQKNTEGVVSYSVRVNSPEVMDNHTVTFRLPAPNAKQVFVEGNFFVGPTNGTRIPMVKGKDGVWEATIGPFTPNIYRYSFIVDGLKIVDPNNKYSVAMDQPTFSIVYIHDNEPQYFDPKENVPHGSLTTHYYYSDVTKGLREMIVYTPANYDPSKKYPVLYLMAGSGDTQQTWIQEGSINFILDNVIAEGKAREMIVAMPHSNILRRNHPQHTELAFPMIEQEFIDNIIPFVEDHYSVIKDRHARAICGLSMGGRMAQYVGFRHLDLFSNFGLLSSAIDDSETPAILEPGFNDKVDYLFVGAGTYETNERARHQVMHDNWVKRGIVHDYWVGGEGAHSMITWKPIMYYHFLPNLFKKNFPENRPRAAAPAFPAESKAMVTNISATSYPRLMPDNSVIFGLYAPQARKVQVDCGGRYDMVCDDNGFWTVRTKPMIEGFHYYRLSIDGVMVSDPASESFYGCSLMCSAIDIPEKGCEYMEPQNVPHGETNYLWYYSEFTKSWRPICIYTPPSYNKGKKKYPVVYIQHGGGEDHRGWVEQGRTGTILDNMIAAGEAEEMIVVSSNSNVGRSGGGSAYSVEGMAPFREELIDNIIPFVDSHYRTKADRKNRAMCGLSMGGGQSFMIGLNELDTFGSVATFSTGMFGGINGAADVDLDALVPGLLSKSAEYNNLLDVYFMTCGEQDPRIEYTKAVVKKMHAAGLEVDEAYYPGDHEWQVWRKSFHDFAKKLFK